ncbi:MAG: hypothetical protein AMJ41_03940 [candidate division Zixibacteria bacterium DG_27]|nr:MAG: hypothetical protein AMJ41_03940 [candidate division Zixibacteria bacterium DG_27]
MKPKTVIILIIAALFLIILLQNTQVVTLRLYFWQLTMSRIILLVVTLLIGFIVGYIVAKVTTRGRKSE